MIRRHFMQPPCFIGDIYVLRMSTTSSAEEKELGGGGVSHTATQPRPIQLGTSGGNARDIARRILLLRHTRCAR